MREYSRPNADFGQTWEPIHIMRDSGGTVTNLDWSPDDSRIVSAGYKDRKAKVWNTEVCRLVVIRELS